MWRLRAARGRGPSPGMSHPDTASLDPHRHAGSLCHRVITTLAATGTSPSLAAVIDAVEAAIPHLERTAARARKQNAAGAVWAYFTRLLPPSTWSYAGSDVHLGTEKVDLLWRDPHGRLLIDELSTAHAHLFASTTTLTQAHSALSQGRQIFGPRLIGARLLNLAHPAQSLYITSTDGQPQLLRDTPYRA